MNSTLSIGLSSEVKGLNGEESGNSGGKSDGTVHDGEGEIAGECRWSSNVRICVGTGLNLETGSVADGLTDLDGGHVCHGGVDFCVGLAVETAQLGGIGLQHGGKAIIELVDSNTGENLGSNFASVEGCGAWCGVPDFTFVRNSAWVCNLADHVSVDIIAWGGPLGGEPNGHNLSTGKGSIEVNLEVSAECLHHNTGVVSFAECLHGGSKGVATDGGNILRHSHTHWGGNVTRVGSGGLESSFRAVLCPGGGGHDE
jgi:hypothetical protein